MVKVISRSESKYFKYKNLYFDARASYNREADTIILFVFKTPTGKWSNKWSALRFNSEKLKPTTNMMDKIRFHYEDLQEKYKKEIKQGYKIAEVIHYSGKLRR